MAGQVTADSRRKATAQRRAASGFVPGRRKVTRWTRNPAWYTARGWTVLSVKSGVDYTATLVAR